MNMKIVEPLKVLVAVSSKEKKFLIKKTHIPYTARYWR